MYTGPAGSLDGPSVKSRGSSGQRMGTASVNPYTRCRFQQSPKLCVIRALQTIKEIKNHTKPL